jgi:sialate O-acetylesterase
MSFLKYSLIAAMLTIGIALAASPATPPLLYPTFQDHMVIQRDKPINVWGTAAPGATVKIAISSADTPPSDKPGAVRRDLVGDVVSAVADADGKWRGTLPARPAGGAYLLTASSGTAEQVVKDVLFGDVYLCSGQSNMEMPVLLASSYYGELFSAKNALIRLMHVARIASPTPREGLGDGTKWDVTSPETVRDFSATCYMFGRDLQPDIKIPLGLIESAWGGSAIEAWLPADALRTLGYGRDLDVLKIYARDAEAGKATWDAIAKEWWRTHDPASMAKPAWSDPTFDDSSWQQAILVGSWENWNVAALQPFDGVVWFRKTVKLTAEQAKGEAVLALGPVDDFDSTWVNGKQIGGGEGYYTNRVYTIPTGTLHEGDNLIAFGVLDVGGGGGAWGPAGAKTLTFADGSKLVLDTNWRYRIAADLATVGGMTHAPWDPASGTGQLYNGMIDPLGPIALRGIVWYQGEANTWNAAAYGKALKALAASWRQRFNTDAAFLNVQLPNYGDYQVKPTASQWADLREQQQQAAAEIPNSGLAVTIDIGQRDNIHPTDKQNVGKRLALIAKKLIYGQDTVADGPRPVTAVRQGKKIVVAFDRDFVVSEANRPLGFQLCDGKTCAFVDAVAEDRNVEIAATTKASEVRFCWADSPICNLFGVTGLPVIPFRLTITEATKKPKATP